MEIPKFLDDLSIISKLGDNPGADNGLTAEGLKAKFDEGPLKLQAYLNDILLEALNSFFSSDGVTQDGLNMIGPINMNKNKLRELPDPTEGGDAVNLDFANKNFRSSNWIPTPSQVGARPDTWVPTAEEVGARPDTWTPTAEEVGARPSNWVPTAEQVGAAPASSVGTNKVFNKLTDIGIKTFPTTMKTVSNSMPSNSTLMLDSRDILSGGTNEISDLGNETAGIYMFMKGNSDARFSLLNIYSSASTGTSHLNYGAYATTADKTTWILGERQNTTYPDSRYRIAADGETEWINPPMLPGTEYRTTERWNGKPVYKKLLTWKIASDIVGAARYEIAHGVTDMDSASLRVEWTTEEWTLPRANATESLYVSGVDTAKNSTKLVVKSEGGSNWGAGRTFYFYLTYCKTA